MNVSDMIPLWVHYNKSINLYIIQIKFKNLKINKALTDLFSYYNYHKKKWCKCRRIMFNGGPSCYPLLKD